jgi:hypothetical protein
MKNMKNDGLGLIWRNDPRHVKVIVAVAGLWSSNALLLLALVVIAPNQILWPRPATVPLIPFIKNDCKDCRG